MSIEGWTKYNAVINNGKQAQESYNLVLAATNRNLAEAAKAQNDKQRAETDKESIDKLKDAYSRLNEVRSKYIAALKSGDADSQTYYQHEIQSADRAVQTRIKEAQAIRMTADDRAKCNAIILEGNRA